MRHTRCLCSPARALHRVFLSDLSSGSSHNGILQAQPSTLRIIKSGSRISDTATTQHQHQIRALTTSNLPGGSQAGLRFINIEGNKGKPKPTKYKLNEEIPYKWVRLVPRSPGGELSPPQRLDSVLQRLNLDTHVLIMVASPPKPKPPTPEEAADPYYVPPPAAAICKIGDLAAMAAVEEERRKSQRRKNVNRKELEFGWAIAPNDLLHKLQRLRAFLERGKRVEVLLAQKRGARKAKLEECEALVRAIRAGAASVPKAREVRKTDGELGAVMKLFFQGPAGKKKKKEGESGGEEDDEEELEEDGEEEEEPEQKEEREWEEHGWGV
ncbi:hypothetical protein F5X99DRAFT_385679 [Biscogniauxia marginata]|nr:hypothetical protein F5X99DRAFT_385679 [Biscogniauxia marginata]